MRWTNESIVRELKRLSAKGADLSSTAMRETPVRWAAIRLFGSYRDALSAAGIDYADVSRRRPGVCKWNREKVAAKLKQLAKRKEDLWSRGVRLRHTQLHAAAVHWYGSYRDAVVASGIDYDSVCHQPPQRWDRANIAEELRRLKRAGECLHYAYMERLNPALAVAAYRHFGSYPKAVDAAGIEYSSVRIRPQRTWHAKRVLSELRAMKRSGDGLWNRAIRRNRPYLLKAARDFFGSYEKAAKSAGIEPDALRSPRFRKPRRITKPSVIKVLRRLHRRGEDLRSSQLRLNASWLVRAAEELFGSYRAALEAARIEYPPKAPLRHWTWPVVIKTLRDLRKSGADLRHSPMQQKYRPLFDAAKYYFGSYVNAVQEAGINYDAVVDRALKKSKRPRRELAGAIS